MKTCLRLLPLFFFLVLPSTAEPHASFLSPIPRMKLTSKTAPCGTSRTTKPTVFYAGQEIEVQFEEYTEHPGYFQILFSPAADKNWVMLLDNIPDKKPSAGSGSAFYTARITLPETPCDQCTLQLIQVMTEDPRSPRLYYSCADLVLVAPGGDFRRGDADGSGAVDLTDAMATLEYLYRDGTAPACLDAADANDDGRVDVSDAVAVLFRLFASAPAVAPGETCGQDPSPDLLSCGTQASCEGPPPVGE